MSGLAASTSRVLGIQVCATTSSLSGAGAQAHGFVHASQTLAIELPPQPRLWSLQS